MPIDRPPDLAPQRPSRDEADTPDPDPAELPGQAARRDEGRAAGPGRPARQNPVPRAVLVVRALPGLGDFLCATPALRALRAALPDARITLLGLPDTRDLVARYPHLVDEFIDFPGFPGLPEAPANVMALPAFLRAVQGRFDLALQMHGDGSVSNIFVQLLAARRTAGFHAPSLPCPDPTTFAPYPQHMPEPLVWLALLRFLGVPAAGQELEFPLGPADEAELDGVLRGVGIAADVRLAVLHVGAFEPRRRLAPGVLAGVADGLAARGLQVVLTGTADEGPIAATVRAMARRRPVDLTGRSAIGALGALIRRAQLVISGDTGVSHLASALRTASVVVFLASDVRRWAPLDRTRHRVVDFSAAQPDAAAILAEADAVLATVPESGATSSANAASSPAAAATLRGVRGARRLLVVPPVGGPAELGPALHRLRAALPDATLVLLADTACEATLVDELVPSGGPVGFNLDDLPALIDRLTAARLDAALVFTAEGETAFEAAYLAYLAGVPLRAGLGAEFGGGVLSSWVRPPPDGFLAADRHLFLLHELGL